MKIDKSLIPEENIQNKIIVVRGVKVMFIISIIIISNQN